ncbi:MAG TPA: DUF5752 family protein [bacterium]|nr:DUF5752 family protein [bacterium]
MAKKKNGKPFELMDCALITLATGKRALNLRELRDRISEIEESSLYYHFYENLLRPSFDDPEFRNDFALWAKRALHDTRLAEKLGTLNPPSCCSMDELRRMLVDVIEDQLAEREFVPWARPEDEFHFLTSRVVVFDTGRRLNTWEELGRSVRGMSTGSIFYHFIEARRRPPVELDDFSAWLKQWEDATAAVREGLARVDYYFWTLSELRERIAKVFADFPDKGEGR